MLGPRGIRVNSVAPGPAWTPLIPSTMPAEKVESFGGNTLLGRPGQPAELAPVYVMLASDEASFLSGTRVVVTVPLGRSGRGHRRPTDPLTRTGSSTCRAGVARSGSWRATCWAVSSRAAAPTR
jgi:hypothetical protein